MAALRREPWCGIGDLDELAARVRQLRADLGVPTVRWSAGCLAAALHAAVRDRGWPAGHAVAALLAVAGDRDSRSPMRLAEAGWWWDQLPPQTPTGPVGPAESADELAGLEARLAEVDGLRLVLQRQAREQLAAEGHPLVAGRVTRLAVARRACQLLDDHPDTDDGDPRDGGQSPGRSTDLSGYGTRLDTVAGAGPARMDTRPVGESAEVEPVLAALRGVPRPAQASTPRRSPTAAGHGPVHRRSQVASEPAAAVTGTR